MNNQNNQNKILGGGEPNLRSKFGAKEFYFGYFCFGLSFYLILDAALAAFSIASPAKGIFSALTKK